MDVAVNQVMLRCLNIETQSRMKRTSCEKKCSLAETCRSHPIYKSVNQYAIYALVYVVSSGMMRGACILVASNLFSKIILEKMSFAIDSDHLREG